MNSIKYIFFDLGDTLVDTSVSRKASYFGLSCALPNKLVIDELISKWEKESCKIFDYYYKRGEFYKIKSLQVMSLKNVLLKYGINLTDHKLANIVSVCWRYLINKCPLYEDVIPTLSRLVRDGYGLGLITDGDEKNVIRILKKHNLNNMFKIKIISSVVKRYKPDSLLFERALEKAQCVPEEVIYVGDSIKDINGAKKLGMITIIIDRNKKQEKTEKLQSDFSVNGLDQLYKIINKS
jgi:2-haloalkanoic acid dehalogenase type II